MENIYFHLQIYIIDRYIERYINDISVLISTTGPTSVITADGATSRFLSKMAALVSVGSIYGYDYILFLQRGSLVNDMRAVARLELH